ncbi:MAG TPA: amidohydrolase family protein, partial [Sandaracinaceae bacterium]
HERLELPANVELALAPHSAIGLHPEALRALFEGMDRPLPMPLATSAAERAFLADGGGPIGAWLRAQGVDPGDLTPPGTGPVEQLEQLGVLGPALAATHLTDARPAELAALAAAGARAVLCPRASLAVEMQLPPLEDVVRAGLAPGLGSDSLAVATSLDVLEDAAALAARFPEFDPGALLAMATSGGARALGLYDKGVLAEGTSPGVLLFEGDGIDDPLRHVLGRAGRPRRVLVRPGAELAR